MPLSAVQVAPHERARTVEELQARIRAMQAAGLGTRTLPTRPEIAPLLPGGALKAGVAYAVPDSLTLAMLLMAGPSAAGGWCAAIDVPDFGIEAAAGFGIDLDRLVLVPHPGEQWLAVAAQIADVLPVVLLRPPARAAAGDTARLASRLRQRGSTLLVHGPWAQAEATLELETTAWTGIETGSGYLAGRDVRVAVTARDLRTVHPVRIRDDRWRIGEAEPRRLEAV
jgi:hypothetical protein